MARRLSKLTNGETVKLFGEPESGKLWERKDGKAEKPHMPTALSLSLSFCFCSPYCAHNPEKATK